MTDVEYRRLSVCSNENVSFTNMKLQNDSDVRTISSIFSQYIMEGPIELDATLMRLVQDICSSSILPRTIDKITTCMVEPEDDEIVNLYDHLSRLFVLYLCF
jgi:hypothetical protein